MSRIGRQPINIPDGVQLELDGRIIRVAGPKGELTERLLPGLALTIDGSQALVTVKDINPVTQKAYGLMRSLIANMVTGVSSGFSRRLEINGVGYRASLAGDSLNLALGLSHPVEFKLPAGVEAKIERNTVTISGFSKQLVGQTAADLRALRKPEPYKGKGIKYAEERIRRKAGKTAARS